MLDISRAAVKEKSRSRNAINHNGLVRVEFCLLLPGLMLAPVLESTVSGAAQAVRQAPSDMPAYSGRSLDSWLQDLVCTPCGPEFEPAVKAIRAMGPPAIPYLVERIQQERHDPLAVTAIRVLGPLAASAAPELTEFFRRNPSSLSAAMALVYLSAEKPVIEALSSPTQQDRENAILAFGYGGAQVDSAAVPALIEHLEKGSPETRSRVIWALSAIRKREDLVIPALLRVVEDQDSGMRRMAVEGLAGFSVARTGDRLIAALGDRDASVRSSAARSLGMSVERTTDDGLVQPIIAALIIRLSDPVADVRADTAWALGAIGPRAKDAVVGLIELTKDGNPQVSQSATASLAHINDKTR